MVTAALVALAVMTLGAALAPLAGPRPDLSPARPAAATRSAQLGAVLRAAAYHVVHRQPSEIEADVVASWCDALARRIRSGSTLRDAVHSVRPQDDRLAAATELMRLGLDRGGAVAEVILTQPPASSGPHVEAARQVIFVAAQLGGSSSAPLDRVAVVLRQRAADRRERRAQAAQAQMSARVLTFVPLAVLAVLVVTDSEVVGVLSTPAGGLCVFVGVFLNVSGAVWMRRSIAGSR